MSSDKSLGQIEWEAKIAFYAEDGWHPGFYIAWDDLNADQKEAQEVGASAVRLAVIEECAVMKEFQSSLTPAAEIAWGAVVQTLMNENQTLKATLTKARIWVEANTAQVRGVSDQAAAPGEAMLRQIDAALFSRGYK